MSRAASRRVSFTPDSYCNEERSSVFTKHNRSSSSSSGGGGVFHRTRKRIAAVCSFRRMSRCSVGFFPARLLRRLRTKLATTLTTSRVASMRRRSSSRNKVFSSSSSSSSSTTLVRSRSISAADPMDSHRIEAVEECIEFLNSCASLQRSNSVTAWSS